MTTRVGITIGEPLGIGPEVVVRSLQRVSTPKVQYVVYGSPSLLEKTSRALDIPPYWSQNQEASVVLRPCGPNPPAGTFNSPAMRAQAVLETLDQAAKDGQRGWIHALVTAPIDKSIVHSLLPSFTGHTGYLGEKAEVERPVMLLDNGELRVALLTEHIPLRFVPEAITPEAIESVVTIACRALQKWFHIDQPRIAVAGLNPHAGEITPEAEEERVFAPTLQKLRGEGFHIEGPLPADSLFSRARHGSWDLLISPYHDQGLVAAKYPGLAKVVNITLGLPYLRISPGHGVAYDIAGQGRADIRSFERALTIAVTRNLKS